MLNNAMEKTCPADKKDNPKKYVCSTEQKN